MYCGRFAPSPTGPLHLGSLLAAVASWLDARAQDGTWILRIEDIDPQREAPGATDQILHSLEAHGLEWDGEVRMQSSRIDLYRKSLQTLGRLNLAYPCVCSRADIARMGGIYDGRCRHRTTPPQGDFAWRLAMNKPIAWQDIFAGPQRADSAAALADPVIWRRDNLVAYQLAVAVDDAGTQISHVIRGADLLDSTAVQLAILDALGLEAPVYGHVPVVLGKNGRKLSKQSYALPLQDSEAGQSIHWILRTLGQPVPAELAGAAARDQLAWARANWNPGAVPRVEAFSL